MSLDAFTSFLAPLIESFPPELCALDQWVAWMAVPDPKKLKPSKVPVNPKNGTWASTAHPKTWATLRQAFAFYSGKQGKTHTIITKDGKKSGPVRGVGFVLTDNDPFVGIDVDGCLATDGSMPDWVQMLVERVGSYTEVSPSKSGLRIFVKGTQPRPGFKNTAKGLEVYKSGRYLTTTGRALNQLPIIENQVALDWIYATFGPVAKEKNAHKLDEGNAPYVSTLDDNTLVQKILASRNGDIFKRLFMDGDLSRHNGDHSAADLALCCILSFWCRKNPAQMDRLFRASALFREKWDEVRVRGATYGTATINKAIENTSDVYQGRRPRAVSKQAEMEVLDTHAVDEEEQESHILPPPPAVPLQAFPTSVGTLLQEASEAFAVPLQIPVTCLLGVLSCLVGGTRLISLRPSWTEPGNIWIATVAASGIGKTPCASAFFKPVKHLEYEAFRRWQDEYASYESELDFYRKERQKAKRGDTIPDKPLPPKRRQAYVDDATVEALGEILAENPRGSMWCKDELAGLIADLDKYSSSGNNGGTRSRLLSAYDGQAWKTSRASNPNRNLHIPHAYVGIFGGIQPAMLPKVFEAGVNGVDEASGFLQRFMLIRAVREKPGYWTEQSFSQKSQNLLASIAEALWSWDIEYDEEGWMREKVVQASPSAKAAFISWFNDIAREEFLSQKSALLSKLKGQAQRICLLLHCLDAALMGTDGMEVVTEDTMNRALILADWVKMHQAQCWQFFQPEKGVRQVDPIQNAIMQVVVNEASAIEAQGGKISNEKLYLSVKVLLGMPRISHVSIGRAASTLGLGQAKIGRDDKARTVTREQMASFRNAVRSDRTVRNPTG